MVQAVCPECLVPSGAGAAGEENINSKKPRSGPNLQPSGACCQRSSFLSLLSWWRVEQSRAEPWGFLPPLPPAPGTSHSPPPAPRATPRWSPCSTQGCLAAPITPRRCQREAPSAAKTPSRGFRRSWGTSQLHRVPSVPAQLPPRAPALPQPELPGGLELPGFRAGPPPARSPSAHFYSNVVYLVK